MNLKIKIKLHEEGWPKKMKEGWFPNLTQRNRMTYGNSKKGDALNKLKEGGCPNKGKWPK